MDYIIAVKLVVIRPPLPVLGNLDVGGALPSQIQQRPRPPSNAMTKQVATIWP